MSGNLAIWNALAKTDPAHTKQFKRAGGFSGTAIKPMWIVYKLTEHFGPVGEGWGMEKPDFTVVPGNNGEVLVYCIVECWHGSPDAKKVVYGVGGDKAVTYIKANEQYNRPERWENDDEAFKKAFTDAVGNAFKFVGVGADVHMGQFENSKYVQQVAREFAAQARNEGQSQTGAVSPHPDDQGEPNRQTGVKLDGPHKSITSLEKAIKAFAVEMGKVGDMREWYGLKNDNGPLLAQAERDHPDWWNGWATQPDGFTPLRRKIEILEAQLIEAAEQKDAA